MASAADPDPRVTEWQEARNVVTAVDGRLATLRQYGMSFVAGLLAAQGLIEFQQTTNATGYVPLEVKFAILIASLLLVAAIYDVDRRELAIQQGAVDRARYLETELKFGLTASITGSYKSAHEFSLTNALYLLFIAATGALGVAVLNPTGIALNRTTIGFIVAAALVAALVLGDLALGHYKRLHKKG